MKTVVALLVLALSVHAASAQSLVTGSPAAGRYEMQPVEGGIARLDTATGEVSLCRIEGGRMTCQPSEEDRRRLEARIRELSGGGGVLRPGPGAVPVAPPAGEDAEFDKALGQIERVFRAFREITREFGDEAPGRAPDTIPDRT